MSSEKFKSLDDIKKDVEEKKKEDSRFTWEKASKLLSSWKEFIKQGCVDEEVYKHRRSVCEGIPGKVPPCKHNFLREKDNRRFCGSCGCGHRELATLYIEGKEINEDPSIRLWMPKSNCPIGAHHDSEGTGSFKHVGGRLKQIAKFAKESLKEIGRFAGTSQEEAVEFTQKEIEGNASSDSEMEEIVKHMEQE